MSNKFDAKTSLEALQRFLKKYENERLDCYEEQTYILDVMFFLGKSIDSEEYNMAPGFRRFVSRKIAKFASEMHKSEKFNFVRQLGKKRYPMRDE